VRDQRTKKVKTRVVWTLHLDLRVDLAPELASRRWKAALEPLEEVASAWAGGVRHLAKPGDSPSEGDQVEFLCMGAASAPGVSKDRFRAICNTALNEIRARFQVIEGPDFSCYDADSFSGFNQGPHHRAQGRRKGKTRDRRAERHSMRQAVAAGHDEALASRPGMSPKRRFRGGHAGGPGRPARLRDEGEE
jgi:hypothetical protein